MTIAKTLVIGISMCLLGCGAKSKASPTIPLEGATKKEEDPCSGQATSEVDASSQADACDDEGYPPDEWND